MKKTILLAFLCIANIATLEAQTFVHQWKMGPLTWNDFSHNTAIGSKCSHLEYYMGIQGEAEKHHGVKYLHPSVNAFMSPEFSWADTHYRTPQLLAYHQCAFDLVELHRRQLEQYIMGGHQSFFELVDPDRLLDNTMQRVGEDIARLDDATQEGRDSAQLSQWQQRVRRQLDSLPPYTFNTHRDAPFRWGFSFDVGYSYIGGMLHDYLGNGFALGFTGDMGVRRHFFTTALTMGGSRCKQQMLQVDELWEINDLYPTDPTYHLDFYIAYGFAVVDNAHLRLTPFVGYGWQHFYYNGFDESSHGPTDGCLHVGVDFHHIFSNQVEVNEFLCDRRYNATHDIWSFHTKLFATYNQFQSVIDAPSGFTINLQVGIALMSGKAECK